MTKDPWPTELRLDKDRAALSVTFESGETFSLSSEFLRVMSPSAEVQGHAPEEKITVPGKRSVHIDRIDPVGHYAIKIVFSDGHDTGLYSWSYLHELGRNHDARWASYLQELSAKGLSRDG